MARGEGDGLGTPEAVAWLGPKTGGGGLRFGDDHEVLGRNSPKIHLEIGRVRGEKGRRAARDAALAGARTEKRTGNGHG